MGLFLTKNVHGDYEINKGAAAAAALATLVGGATLVDGVVFTTPEHTTLVLTAGKPDRFAPVGPSLKIPFWERTYKVKTSVSDVPLDEANIALQNGTVTAEHLQSTTRIQINGTLAEREQTVTMLREKMPDFQARIKAFSEKALRDVVRLTVVASEDSQESQEVTSVKNGNHMNFLDTKSVGAEVARIVQDQINSIIPGTVKQGDKDVPRLEVTEFQIGQFEFDKDYLSRRQKIADSRAKAEAARFEKAEAERKAEARAAQAEGERRATVAQAQGDAEATKLRKGAEAEGLSGLVKAAGGPDKLREQTLAEKWDGKAPQVVGGSGVIVDGRFAPGVKDVTGTLGHPANER